jgi:hypothetical protein
MVFVNIKGIRDDWHKPRDFGFMLDFAIMEGAFMTDRKRIEIFSDYI